MALFLQYISSPTGNLGKKNEIRTAALRFLDQKFWGRLASNFIDTSKVVSPTDVLVHICSTFSDRALTGGGEDTAGATQVVETENLATGKFVITQVYSEIWLDQLMSEFAIGLDDPENIGRLIAITALHEGMHNKVEPLKQQKKRGWNLHKRGGGGVALSNASITKTDGMIDASITSKNQMLILEFFSKPLPQLHRKS